MMKIISLDLWRRGLKRREQELYGQLMRFPELPVVKFVGKVRELQNVLRVLSPGSKEVA